MPSSDRYVAMCCDHLPLLLTVLLLAWSQGSSQENRYTADDFDRCNISTPGLFRGNDSENETGSGDPTASNAVDNRTIPCSELLEFIRNHTNPSMTVFPRMDPTPVFNGSGSGDIDSGSGADSDIFLIMTTLGPTSSHQIMPNMSTAQPALITSEIATPLFASTFYPFMRSEIVGTPLFASSVNPSGIITSRPKPNMSTAQPALITSEIATPLFASTFYPFMRSEIVGTPLFASSVNPSGIITSRPNPITSRPNPITSRPNPAPSASVSANPFLTAHPQSFTYSPSLTPGEPVMPSSTVRALTPSLLVHSVGLTSTPSLVPTSTGEAPTTVPARTAPATPEPGEHKNNQAQVTVENLSLEKWESLSDTFKEKVALAATTYCRANPSSCGLTSLPFQFESENVIVEVNQQGGKLAITVSLQIPKGTPLSPDLATVGVITGSHLVALLDQDQSKDILTQVFGNREFQVSVPSTPQPATQPVGESESDSSLPLGAIAGGAGGGLLILVLIILSVCIYKKKRRGSFSPHRRMSRVAPQPVDTEHGVVVPIRKHSAPIIVQEAESQAWAKPPKLEEPPPLTFENKMAVAPLNNNWVGSTELKSMRELESIPMQDLSRPGETPGTLPQRHRGEIADPSSWPEADQRTSAGRLTSKSSLPPIGTKPN